MIAWYHRYVFQKLYKIHWKDLWERHLYGNWHENINTAAELPTVTKKNRICYEIWKGIRKYESASKKYDFSVIRNRMLPPFISDRKSKNPTFILA